MVLGSRGFPNHLYLAALAVNPSDTKLQVVQCQLLKLHQLICHRKQNRVLREQNLHEETCAAKQKRIDSLSGQALS